MRLSHIFPLTEGMTFITQQGQPKESMFTIIQVFSGKVWMASPASFLLISYCMHIVASLEEKILNKKYYQWSKKKNIVWFSLATVIGQSITRFTESNLAWALR